MTVGGSDNNDGGGNNDHDNGWYWWEKLLVPALMSCQTPRRVTSLIIYSACQPFQGKVDLPHAPLV